MPPIDYKETLVITAVTDIPLNGRSRAVNAKDLARRHRLHPPTFGTRSA
jgi:hypothetical protein